MPTDVPSNAPSAFFSYCRADSEFALKLAEDLKAAGANVWIDQLDIEPGTPWDGAVEDALRNAPRMLVILSTVSVASANVRDEISYALDRQKRIIPVLVSDCDIPIRLSRLQHIDFRTDYARGLRLLLRSLGVEAQVPPPKPAEAAAGKAKAEQSELDRKAAQEKVRHEESAWQSAASEKIPPPPQNLAEALRVTAAKFPAWGKLTAGVGAVSLVIWLLYPALLHKKQPLPSNPPTTTDTTAASVPPGFSADIAQKYREAQAGSADAMVDVGGAYDLGEGAPLDYKQAAYWYRKAADAGNPQGMRYLAVLYEHGRGVTTDYEQAAKWALKAAKDGNAGGMNEIGWLYRNGWGVPQDDHQAVDWWRKAIDGGNPMAMANLGAMYEYGRGGLPRDYKQAVYWYRKAADAGSEAGMAYLADMYENGKGVNKNYQQAVDLYRKAAGLGDQYAKDALKRLGENP